MTLKAAMLLLALLLIVGMLGKWRSPRVDKSGNRPIEAARKCAVCDAYVLGSAPCERTDCPQV